MRALLIVALLCGCDTISKVTTLEARVTILEKRINAMVASDFSANDVRETRLRACLDEADDAYWRHVKLNGRKTERDTWRATPDVFAHASKLKEAAMEECKLLNGR